MENKYKIDSAQLIFEYMTEDGIRQEFESMYNYALYICGGDWDLFDDYPVLGKFMELTKHM